jgi:hypothetical protein
VHQSFIQGPFGSGLDMLRGVEIGPSDSEVDYLYSLRGQSGSPLKDPTDAGEGDIRHMPPY